ncbi:DUF3500 domain-containing protein [Actinoallomurus purpureus]|uniref:DUF3500 domain-containing protein n=1 Tax=Actinoallomurus purpureus TaxID=478114 RepID=UPI0020926F5F|nr:DUF3500 domain-containing protein [Actinoallomurus purpureus]MCO6007859.1 DUF3500 domain-containing protein [Actinoallomurus purpureus]
MFWYSSDPEPARQQPRPPHSRRVAGAVGAATALLVVTSCSSGTAVSTGSDSFAQAISANASAVHGAPIKKTTAAAKAFLATLDAEQKNTVLFDWTDQEQKQRWSNFPYGVFPRAGLKWGDLSTTQQNAWLAIMKASLSHEGYKRVLAEWNADDANATETGQSNLFGKKYYYIALIGNPSTTGPWMWQFGGHHVTVNAAVTGGRISLTPSFIGDQPASYTDAGGKTVRPLGDIEDQAFALVGSLDTAQKEKAVLGDTPIDLVLGPGEDGKTIAPEGLRLSEMTAHQRAAALKVIRHYTGLVDDADAAARMREVKSALRRTYFAWYGPTTPGSAAYFRFTGPTLVIEYSPQGAGRPGGGGPGGGTPSPTPSGTPSSPPQDQAGTPINNATTDHIHGIYRDPTNEYGDKYAS